MTTKKLPKFTPCVGIVSVANPELGVAIVCSVNEESYYREMGYTREGLDALLNYVREWNKTLEDS